MSRKVLITGASGFIGSGVLNYMLLNTDWEFTCICSWRHRGNPLNIIPGPRITIVTHDLVGPLPEVGEFDYILHLASESHVDRSIADPVSFIENNVLSTLQVLEYARSHRPQVFIQFSTDEVFGAVTDHAEWDLLLPGNPYAASKAAQEMIALAYWRTYDVPVVITNSNNIVGSNQNAEKFVPKLLGLIRDDQEVVIHTADGKPGSRYYNSVRNVADALLFILDREPHRSDGLNRLSRYSLPGGHQLDNLEMAQLIAKLMGKSLRYKLVDVQGIRPGYDKFYPKTDGSLTRLGWVPPFSLEDELKSLVSET